MLSFPEELSHGTTHKLKKNVMIQEHAACPTGFKHRIEKSFQ